MKILAIRIGRAGDIVMITPALRAIIDANPGAELHILTSPDGNRVLKNFAPELTRLIVHDRKSLLAFYHVRKIEESLHQEKYDQVFCFELNPRFSDLSKRLTNNALCIDHSNEAAHYSRRCLDVVERAGIELQKEYWANLPLHSDAVARNRDLLLSAGIGDDDFVIGFHPTFSGVKKARWRKTLENEKLWPASSFATLAELLSTYAEENSIQLKIMMDLMPDERDIGDEIVRLSDGRVTMLTPPLDFERYKATLARMDLLVTPDTGPMHIAAAIGTRMVALFGGTRPEDCGPYAPPERHVILQAESEAVGIASITPQQAFEACCTFLNK